MTEAQKERDLIIELFHIIGRQPELHQEWEDMPNAERNVMAGAFYNVIKDYSAAKSEAVLDECETFDIIRFLKIRYGEEEAIMDALENVEDEVFVLSCEQVEEIERLVRP